MDPNATFVHTQGRRQKIFKAGAEGVLDHLQGELHNYIYIYIYILVLHGPPISLLQKYHEIKNLTIPKLIRIDTHE